MLGGYLELLIWRVPVRFTVFDARETRKEAAIREALNSLVWDGMILTEYIEELHRDLLMREFLGSTGIGRGIAIPHARHVGISTPIVMICRSSEGMEWDSLDGELVRVAFLQLFSPARPGDSLRVLEALTRIADTVPIDRLIRGSLTEVGKACSIPGP
jgi:nitrogen PTS system EIIA component